MVNGMLTVPVTLQCARDELAGAEQALLSERDSVLKDIVEFYRLVDATAQRGSRRETGLRICLLGYCTAAATRRGLRHTGTVQASHPTLPLVAQLEAELRACRREVYAYVRQHDAAWLRGVEDHVRRAEALRPGKQRTRKSVRASRVNTL